MQYSFSDWNKQSGTLPVTWKSQDYVDSTSWYLHGVPNKGFTADDNSYEIYQNNIGVLIPEKVLPVFEEVKLYFDLENCVVDLSKYTPGMILPWHHDDYPTYSKNMNVQDLDNIVRIIVFLHDPEPGQQLWIDDKLCTGKAGSWFSWTGKTKHMAANLSLSDRYVIQLTGVVKN